MVKVLVAGVGNIFLGDDGFGSAVLQQLTRETLPSAVTAIDFGISSVHLTYELMNGYDAVILVDTVRRGGEPGTLYVLDLEAVSLPDDQSPLASTLDPHAFMPDWTLILGRALSERCRCVRLIGCEPALLDEGIGLSPLVAAAIPAAVQLVKEQVQALLEHVADKLGDAKVDERREQ